ncbi:ABC transporter substrate-binding protein [Pseudomonas matsuisoli]
MTAGALLLMLAAPSFGQSQSVLRIGLQDDPDVLDPHRSRTYAGRIVYAGLCDKLVEVTPKLTFEPRLATEWSWSDDEKTLTLSLRDGVTFHDGEPFDAAAVKANLDRARTLPESLRKSELASIDTVEVIDPMTVALKLKAPDATLISQLSDRAGMMLSPKAFATEGSYTPICSGPYAFEQRVQQDRIVLTRFEGYWNKDAYHFDKVIYLPIPDTSVRLANLRSGDLDVIERTAPSDVKSVESDSRLQLFNTPGLGFAQIYINTNHGDRAKNPLGQDKRVRQAFELTLDRNAINQVVFEGLYAPTNQPFAMSSPYHDDALTMHERDPARSQALLAEAGVKTPLNVQLTVANNPIGQQVGQIVQAMAAEGGFQVSLQTTEMATLLSEQQAGNYQASLFPWSGRPDPDGNIHQFVTCKGTQNDGRYCNAKVDELLNEARSVNDESRRKELYREAMAIIADELPLIYLYFDPRIIAMTAKLQGFVPHPDGLIRLNDLRLQ